MWFVYLFNVLLFFMMVVLIAVTFYLQVVPFDVVEDIYVRYRTKNMKNKRKKIIKKDVTKK